MQAQINILIQTEILQKKVLKIMEYIHKNLAILNQFMFK